MGLSIHYRGSLTDKRRINDFIDEVEDIAQSLEWPFRVLDDSWAQKPDANLTTNSAGQAEITGNLGLKGVLFTPPKCESVSLCFNASGELSSMMNVIMSAEDDYMDAMSWISVKTQFAGAEVHIAIVKLLRYLKGKYLHDLEVDDEGDYWETGDAKLLGQKLDFLGDMIERVAGALEHLEHTDGTDIVDKIERVLRERFKPKDGEG